MILLSLGIVGKMRYDYKQLEKAYKVTQDSLKAQIEGLKDIHASEIAQRDEALSEYHDTLKQIERDYQDSQDAIEEIIEEQQEEFGRQYSEDPAALAEQIEITYGIEYVP